MRGVSPGPIQPGILVHWDWKQTNTYWTKKYRILEVIISRTMRYNTKAWTYHMKPQCWVLIQVCPGHLRWEKWVWHSGNNAIPSQIPTRMIAQRDETTMCCNWTKSQFLWSWLSQTGIFHILFALFFTTLMILIFQDLILSSNLHSLNSFWLLTVFTDNQKCVY